MNDEMIEAFDKFQDDNARGADSFDFTGGWNAALESLRPTHYAVIDEYGDILYARRTGGLLDAVEQCEYYIEQCKKDPVTRHSAKGWTVKEVTLHE